MLPLIDVIGLGRLSFAIKETWQSIPGSHSLDYRDTPLPTLSDRDQRFRNVGVVRGRWIDIAPMPPTGPMARESTAAMARNIARELAEIRVALANSRGDLHAEPKLNGVALAHLLLCSSELL